MQFSEMQLTALLSLFMLKKNVRKNHFIQEDKLQDEEGERERLSRARLLHKEIARIASFFPTKVVLVNATR